MTAVAFTLIGVVGTLMIMGPFLWICWLEYRLQRAEIDAWRTVNEVTRPVDPDGADHG